MNRPIKIKIGEILLNKGIITPIELESALRIKETSDAKLGKILIDLGYVTEEELAVVVASQLNMRFVRVVELDLSADLVLKLPEFQAKKFRAVVLDITEEKYVVGMVDPYDLNAYDKIIMLLGNEREIEIVCITESDCSYVIDKFYKDKDKLKRVALELENNLLSVSNFDNSATGLSDDAPVIKLLQGIFDDAMRLNASDVHIEPQKDEVFIRLRIDGILVMHLVIPSKVCAPMISKLKIMAHLDISERRLPQDGKFQISLADRGLVDVRLSIINSNYGEGAVMRLLRQDSVFLNLDELNMPLEIYEEFKKIIHSQEGMLLVVGPTGSGKTTTLYAALSEINDHDKKIITIEDPIEYSIKYLNQINVNEKIGLSFEAVLRSVLRQDPDVILVGEIRDEKTAQVAMRSAITGHLIFSTLHTKDARSAPVRLIDMGIPGYMVASSLRGVLSQRLIRVNCNDCIEEYKPEERDLVFVKKILGEDVEKYKFYHGVGCTSCNHKGFKGRTGIYEFLNLDDRLLSYLYKNDLNGFSLACEDLMQGKTMNDNLKSLLRAGITSLEEVKRLIV
jgi:MSHA biogenesis protein MshE